MENPIREGAHQAKKGEGGLAASIAYWASTVGIGSVERADESPEGEPVPEIFTVLARGVPP